MRDITNANLIYLKGLLFLFGGLFSSVIIVIEYPTVKVAVLLAVSIWCFARCYYFAFYVIEHYIDKSYKFSGLWSFALYMVRKKKGDDGSN